MTSSRFQNAFSLLQKKHKNSWPDPESSVGKFCGTKQGRFRCWKAQGPAHEVFEHMSIEIKELLEKDCGPVPSSSFVHFDIFMIGETPGTAIPHIMFACKKREPRKEALAAVRKSEILGHYMPGIELGHWDYPPYIKDLQFLGSSTDSVEFDESTGCTAISQCHLTPVFNETQPWKVTAMQLQLTTSDNGLGSLRNATVGSILEVAGKRFYLAPAHIFPGCSLTPHIVSNDEIENEDSDCEFGGFEGSGEEDEVEFMSQYSVTPDSSDVDYESDFGIEDYSSDGDNEEALSIEPRTELTSNEDSSFASKLSALEVAETVRQVQSPRLKIKSPSFTAVELDCAMIEVSNNDYLTTTLPIVSRTSVCQVGPGDVDVMAITGSGIALTGTLSGRPLYIRFPDTRKYQKAFVVDFAENLQPGDCGSIVRNARTGDIYGHIFAGSVESKVAYIIPAMDILEVVERKFNVFPTSNEDVNLLLQDEAELDTNEEQVSDDVLSAKECLYVPNSSEIHDSATPLAEKRAQTCHDYTIAWICALPLELAAARKMLDIEYDPLPQSAGSYVLGAIGHHNVVIPNPSSTAFDGQTTSAMASQVHSTFPNVNIYLAVGISDGSQAPFNDVRLGDVVVGFPSGSNDKVDPDALTKTYSAARILKKKRIPSAVKRLIRPELHRTFLSSLSRPMYPMVKAQVRHSAMNSNQSLEETDHSDECSDEQRYCCQLESDHWPISGDDGPRVNHAPIVPSNQVTDESPIHNIVSRVDNIGFEMEVAGILNLPSLIIRGVCDYAGTEKEVDWQEHAAAAAAAYARDLLLSVSLEVLRSLCAKFAIEDRYQSETNTEAIDPSPNISMTSYVSRRHTGCCRCIPGDGPTC